MLELLFQFLLIWAVLFVLVKYVIGWPKELDAIRKQHSMGTIVGGLFRPQSLADELSVEQLRVFKRFRLIYFAVLILLVLGMAGAAYYVDMRLRDESPLFSYQETGNPN